jgi:hypothetical protein
MHGVDGLLLIVQYVYGSMEVVCEFLHALWIVALDFFLLILHLFFPNYRPIVHDFRYITHSQRCLFTQLTNLFFFLAFFLCLCFLPSNITIQI